MTTTTTTNSIPKKRTAAEICELISGCDLVLVRKGVYKALRGYFYRHGATSEGLAQRVRDAFPTAQIIDQGDHWAAFKGGAPLTKQSHFWVTFTL